MAAQEGHELDREAKAHMALAVLLRKNRPAQKRAEVRRILESDLSTSRIVEAIRRLDAETTEDVEEAAAAPSERTPSVEETPRREEPDDDTRPQPGRAPNPYRLPIAKLKSVLKRPRMRPSFFAYLFREYPRIADFGRMTHVFSPVFLLPVLRLEPGIPKFFAESLTAWANELLSLLAPVLIVGWQHLTKKQYNMLVALDRLCREITTTNLRLLNLRDRNLIDKLRTLEVYFLSFHYNPESSEAVIGAIGEAMSSEPELGKRAERAQLLVSRILEPEFTIPSLFNLILGLNMLKTRTAIDIKELFTLDIGELFETENYACDSDVKTKIDALVDQVKTRVAKLHREWSRLSRLRDLAQSGESEGHDFVEVRSVYEYTSTTLKPRSFDEDRRNVMDFAPNFFRRFESCCSPLLDGSIRLEGRRSVEILAGHAFQNELDRLRLTASKLERSAFGFRSFPYARYLSIRNEGKAGVAIELEIVSHLQEAAAALVGIGSKLERVLSATRETQGNEGEASTAARTTIPLDPTAIRADRRAILPHQAAVVAKGTWLGGRTVRAAVASVASVCFQCAKFLREESFVEALAMEAPMHARIEEHLRTIHRIADEAVYDQLVGLVLRKNP